MGGEQTKLDPSGRSEDFGFYSLKWEPWQGLKHEMAIFPKGALAAE